MIWYVYDLEKRATVASYSYRGTAIKFADSLNLKRRKKGKRYEAMPQKRLLELDERERLNHVMLFAPPCSNCRGTGKDLQAAIRAFHDKRFQLGKGGDRG